MGENFAHEVVQPPVFFRRGGKNPRFALHEFSRREIGTSGGNKLPCGFRRGFQVELKSDDVLPYLERLIPASIALGEQDGTIRQIKSLTVPVESFTRIWEAKDIPLVRFCRTDLMPSDFFFHVRVDLCTERVAPRGKHPEFFCPPRWRGG